MQGNSRWSGTTRIILRGIIEVQVVNSTRWCPEVMVPGPFTIDGNTGPFITDRDIALSTDFCL